MRKTAPITAAATIHLAFLLTWIAAAVWYTFSILAEKQAILNALPSASTFRPGTSPTDFQFHVVDLWQVYILPPGLVLAAMLMTLAAIALFATSMIWQFSSIKYVMPPSGERTPHNKWACLWYICPIASFFIPLQVYRWIMRRLSMSHINWLSLCWPLMIIGYLASPYTILLTSETLVNPSEQIALQSVITQLDYQLLTVPIALVGIVANAVFLGIITIRARQLGNLDQPIPADFQEIAQEQPGQQ